MTGPLLRPPGESLRIRIEEITSSLFEALFIVTLLPSLLGATILFYPSVFARKLETASIAAGIAICVCFTAYYVRRILKLLPERQDFRLGLEGEMAVAEELNKLMHDGYHVYHDFPANKFNIDHILIGPAGVFAVETKTRSKRKDDRGKTAAEVTYDGSRLDFPNGYDIDALTQAKDQGTWLEKWLTSAVGERVGVEPILTLPGWYVKRIKQEPIHVLNPKEIPGHVTSEKKILSETLIKRIIHQVEQRCRNVGPKEG